MKIDPAAITRFINLFIKWSTIGGLLLLLAACGEKTGTDEDAEQDVESAWAIPTERYTGDLDKLRKRGVIRALVTYGQSDFFIRDGRPQGIQVDLLKVFEKQLNKGIKDPAKRIRIQYVVVPFSQLIPGLESGRGDIAAAFMTLTPQRKEHIDFVRNANLLVTEIAVRHVDQPPLAQTADLDDRDVYVMAGSSYAEHLRGLEGIDPDVVEVDQQLLSEDILELVNAGVFPLTVIDDYRARFWARVMPDIVLEEQVEVASDNAVGWGIRKHSPQLRQALTRFFAEHSKGSLLGNMLFSRYFENTQWVRNPTVGDERDRLQRYLKYFRKYGERYAIDPLALAAQAFQESGLDPDRKSHRGAVGLMQLLPSTAADKHVAITDITDVEQNVHAAAKYLAFLRDRYFSDAGLTPENQLALMWAAYNAGPAKVRRMRRRAESLGLDPDRWKGNVEVAAARLVGQETVDYVAHVRKYHLAYRLAGQARRQRARSIESVSE